MSNLSENALLAIEIIKQKGHTNTHDLIHLLFGGLDVRPLMKEAKERKVYSTEVIEFLESGSFVTN